MMRRWVGCLALLWGCGRADVATDPARVDRDGDRYYAPPEGNDCDDLNPLVHPSAPDTTCDGVDNDCYHQDGPDDADEDGFTLCEGDCDDADAARAPDQVEVCDASDNDCDGEVDDGFDLDHDGQRVCGPGVAGGLRQHSPFTEVSRLRAPLLAADLDKDGRSELLTVAISPQFWWEQTTLLSNLAECLLCSRAPIAPAEAGSRWFRAVDDADGDGFPDVALGEIPNVGPWRIRLLRGGATPIVDPLEDKWPEEVTIFSPNFAPIGDLDADGLVDIVMALQGMDGTSIHLAEVQQDGLVIEPEPLVSDRDMELPFIAHVLAMELTGDAWPDLVVTGLGETDRPWGMVLRGSAAGPTPAGAITLSPPRGQPTVVETIGGGDYDGDGQGDMLLHVAASEDGELVSKLLVLYGAADGVRTGPLIPIHAAPLLGNVRAMPDLDHDGRQDVVALVFEEIPDEVNTELGFIMPVYEVFVDVWSLSPEPARRQHVLAGQSTALHASGIEIADLTGDGSDDLVVVVPDGWDQGSVPGWMAVYDLAGDCDDLDPTVWQSCP